MELGRIKRGMITIVRDFRWGFLSFRLTKRWGWGGSKKGGKGGETPSYLFIATGLEKGGGRVSGNELQGVRPANHPLNKRKQKDADKKGL